MPLREPRLRGATSDASSGHWVRALVALLVGLIAVSGVTGAVSAHTEVDFTLPTDGAFVGDPVDEVTVAFLEPVELVGNGFEALDPQGNVVVPFPVSTDNIVFRLQFDPPLAGGAVGVRYEVRAQDGHIIDGSFSFTVDTPPPTVAPSTAPPTTNPPDTTPSTDPQPTDPATTDPLTTDAPATSPTAPTPSDAEAPTDGDSAAGTTTPTDPAASTVSTVSSADDVDGDGDGGNSGLIISVAVVVAVAAAGFVLLRSRTGST